MRDPCVDPQPGDVLSRNDWTRTVILRWAEMVDYDLRHGRDGKPTRHSMKISEWRKDPVVIGALVIYAADSAVPNNATEQDQENG